MVGLALSLALAGCASTPPAPEYSAATSPVKIGTSDKFTVEVEPASGVTMLDLEKQRLTQVIQQKIDLARAHDPSAAEPRDYAVTVLVTRYEKGSAFARAMLAGLGQIHLDATVSVDEGPAKTRVSEFKIDKTFAWGGAYGGFTRIEDVEPAFAEGVAAALTGAK